MINDEFAAAVIAAVDPSAAVSADFRKQAIASCDNLKRSAEGWKVCLERLLTKHTDRHEVTFFCLMVLEEYVDSHYGKLPDEQRTPFRQSVMDLLGNFIRPGAALQQGFIKNKLCLVIVKLVKHDYPTRWPDFFTDMLKWFAVQLEREAIDVFLRILKIVDEEIAEFEADRTEAEIQTVMLIKQTLKVTCIQDIVGTMYNILVQCQTKHVDLAARCLDTLAEYIGWVDISFVANERFIALLYHFLQVPDLQELAADCINEIIFKRLNGNDKIKLIKTLNIFQVLEQTQLKNEGFAIKIAAIVDTLGQELLMCTTQGRKVLKGSCHVLDADEITPHLEAEAAAMLQQALGMGYNCLEFPSFRVQEQVLEFYLSFTNILKALPAMGDVEEKHYRRIFLAAANGLAFPDWYQFEDLGDDEIHFQRFRDSGPKRLFVNLLRCQPDLGISLLTAFITSELSSSNLTPAKIEALLTLLYLVQEGIKNLKTFLKQNSAFYNVVGSLLMSDVSNTRHAAVQIQYFKCCNRYVSLFESHTQLIPVVVGYFMDTRGIQSSNPTVRSQACYLLWRFIKGFSVAGRSHLQPLATPLIEAVQAVITPFLQKQTLDSAKDLSLDDCDYLCELMGIMVSSDVVGATNNGIVLGQVASFFQSRLDSILSHQHIWSQSELDAELACNKMAQIMSSIGCMSKALTKDSKACPNDPAVHRRKAPASCSSAPSLPCHAATPVAASTCVRTNHSAAVCTCSTVASVFSTALKSSIPPAQDGGLFGEAVIPSLPHALEVLLVHSSQHAVVPLLQLISQLMAKFNERVASVVDGLFEKVVQVSFAAIHKFDYIDASGGQASAGYTVDKQDRDLIFKSYYQIIKMVTSTPGLAFVLTSDKNKGHINQILSSVTRGCSFPQDVAVHKTCFHILNKFVEHWHSAANGNVEASVRSFIFQDITAKVFECLSAPYISPNPDEFDAGALLLVKEIVSLQITCAKCFSEAYLNTLGEYLVCGPLKMSQDWAKGYCMALAGTNQNDSKMLLMGFVKDRAKRLKANYNAGFR
eukprot:CAMPEP_0175178820 /NCGR_PEP_ID=MMETSP0087-20121206/35178_1 /TAXON_ID=136419 /ORGANISM="Unknown Unknown, Strain D1" /LENGTH=1039 /DNA_ID=CAMNT_0016470999 /DNA_START=1 /DNA_END=3121 /DNA_ORIENTATION=+